MSWFNYLLEANIYLLVFYGFYKLALQGETFYTLNRFYLLFTSLLAFIAPCFQLSGLRPLPAAMPVQYLSVGPAATMIAGAGPDSRLAICITLYLLVVMFLLTRLCIRVFKILHLAKANGVQFLNGIKRVELPGKNTSFCFWDYLFIDPQLPGTDIIIRHEMVHIREHHTVDILFFELLQLISWFNPVVLLLKKEIIAVHEFIADENTLNKETDAESYSMFLISHSAASMRQKLGNQMFYSLLLEKRIMRLYQKRSKRSIRWKYLVIAPVLLLMVGISSMAFTKTYAIDLMPQVSGTNQKGELVNRFEKYPVFDIDARTDTVKIRKAPGRATDVEFKGIYVVDKKIYSAQDLRTALKQTGKMDIVLPKRPVIGFYTANDADAIKRWGEQAKNGVMFIIPRMDTTAGTAHP